MKLVKLIILSTILCFAQSDNMRESTSVLDRYIHNLDNIDLSMDIELYDSDNQL